MIDTDNWPSFADELGRKTSAALERWTRNYELEKVTLKEFFIAVTALYDATSGLVPKEVSDLLADIEKDLRHEAKRRKAAA